MKKSKRNDGWVTPICTLTGPNDKFDKVTKRYIIDNVLEPQPYYDNWAESRDGQRDKWNDYSKLKRLKPQQYCSYYSCDSCIERIHMNKKIKRLEKRRRDQKKGKFFIH